MLFRAGAATAHVDLAAATSSRRGKSAGAAAARVNLAAADTGREVCRQAQQDAGAHASRRPHATMALLSYGDQLVSINSSYCHTMFIPEVFFGVRSSTKHGTGGVVLGFCFTHAGPLQREKFMDYCFFI